MRQKFLFAVAILGAAALMVTSASAQIVADIDPAGSQSSCISLKSSGLRYMARDAATNWEVSSLQNFLQAKGYLNSEPTGYFGLMTLSAVKSFQRANGIEATGYVGIITRAKIQVLSCNGVGLSSGPTTPVTVSDSGCPSGALYNPITGARCGQVVPITSRLPFVWVLYPNGGETFYRTQASNLNIPIKWITSGVSSTTTLDVFRLRNYDSGVEYNLAYNVVNSNSGQKDFFVPATVPDGSYTLEIKDTYNNTTLFDKSDSYFKIVSSSPTLACLNGSGPLLPNQTYCPQTQTQPTITADKTVTPSETYVRFTLGRYPSNAVLWFMTIDCPAGVTAVMKGKNCGEALLFTKEGASAMLDAWFINNTSSNQIVTAKFKAAGANNGIIGTSQVSITVAPKAPTTLPDLKISDVQCTPASPKVGEWINCSVTAYNDSSVYIGRSFSVNIQGSLAFIPSLGAYEKKTVSVPQYPFSFSVANTNKVNFVVDAENTIVESNENNNVFEKTIVITAIAINYDACRLDKLDGSNITRNAYTVQSDCLSKLCDVYGPANLRSGTPSKCVFNGTEIKRYQSAPTCTLTSNKTSYVFGETMNFSWTSQNATYAWWYLDTSSKDRLNLPGDKLAPSGSQAVVASVVGNPTVTIWLGGNGKVSCSKTVNIAEPIPPCLNGSGPLLPGQSYCPSLPSVTVITLNEGGYWYTGMATEIKWITANIPASNQMIIRLRNYDTGIEYNLTTSVNDGYEKIVLPANIPVGPYTIEIKTSVNGQSYVDASDLYFKVPSDTSRPTITVDKSTTASDSYVRFNLGMYPSYAHSWTFKAECPAGVTASMKATDCGQVVRFENPNSTTAWDALVTNNTAYKQTITATFTALDVSSGVIGTAQVSVIVAPKATNYDACRLDKLDGSNITRNAYTVQSECLSKICDVYGPANLNASGLASKCMFNGAEIKRYEPIPCLSGIGPLLPGQTYCTPN